MNPEIIGLVAGIFTTGATIPQILKSYRIKECRDISLLYFLAIVMGVILWLIYGLMIRSTAVIFWNTVALLLNSIILFQKIYYDSKSRTT